MSLLFKLLGIAILAGYGLLAVFGLFLVAPKMHDGMTMSNCPFAVGEQSICPMDTAQHVEAWQQFSLTPFSTLFVLGVITLIFLFSNYALYSPRFLLFYRRMHSSIPALFQLLFSQGILNSKAP